MNPSTVTTCFGYQKHYSMKTKCVWPDRKNADNENFASDKLRQTAHGIVEKGMHLKLEIWTENTEIQRVGKEDFK